MYYYIVDLPPKHNLTNLSKRIKSILNNLGINGEFAISSPARSAYEFAEIGLDKGYSTIVAIGGDNIVNNIISLIASRNVVLGIIPVGLSRDLSDLFNIYTIKGACLALKHRKIKEVDLAHIIPNKYFLSTAEIYLDKPFVCEMEIDKSYTIQTTLNELIITSNLDIEFSSIPSMQEKKSWWKRLKRDNSLINESLIHADSVTIKTPQPIPVNIGDVTIAKTPLQIIKKRRVLKIITARDNI